MKRVHFLCFPFLAVRRSERDSNVAISAKHQGHQILIFNCTSVHGIRRSCGGLDGSRCSISNAMRRTPAQSILPGERVAARGCTDKRREPSRSTGKKCKHYIVAFIPMCPAPSKHVRRGRTFVYRRGWVKATNHRRWCRAQRRALT